MTQDHIIPPAQTIQAEQVYTPKETAAFLKVSEHTLSYRRNLRDTSLPWIKLGGKLVRYRGSDILEYIQHSK